MIASPLRLRGATHYREAAWQAAAEKHAGDEAPAEQIGGSNRECRRTLPKAKPRHGEKHNAPMSEAIRKRRENHEPDTLAGEVSREYRAQLRIAQRQRARHIRRKRPKNRVDQAV
jgi:hypothetical protein